MLGALDLVNNYTKNDSHFIRTYPATYAGIHVLIHKKLGALAENKEWQQAPPLLYGCLDESSSQPSNIVSKATHQTPVGNAAATAAATLTALIRDTFHRYAGQLAKWCCHSESESELWPEWLVTSAGTPSLVRIRCKGGFRA
ncbi:hypothetical protein BDQ94DRAFT_151515 [Aspergillus welwitschiae]|uniref:Uncharacterized protein n=1 Tax=Aspergillus welwitschiae TaxID=1341132 RepID=A0A3F3PPB3_9EURO|nr:hypothetical protein BDQ94DRAFT_151515 [Aspergillus welwitschiae]RDH28767.1 hypothetical protein BDQ94DRAFT_151515 [Aspergillus welwitschiae]